MALSCPLLSRGCRAEQDEGAVSLRFTFCIEFIVNLLELSKFQLVLLFFCTLRRLRQYGRSASPQHLEMNALVVVLWLTYLARLGVGIRGK